MLLDEIRALLAQLQAEKMARFQRRVSVGDLLTDRWEIARQYGFGEGASCYDNVLVIGDVRAGANCWIGPNVVLDGSGGGIHMGEWCAISAGVHIYTHDTVDRSLTAGRKPPRTGPVRIGERTYVGPQSVISSSTTIGSGAVIGAMSFVNADVPDATFVWGAPARPRGRVEIRDGDEVVIVPL
jgi:acetyltransferase-like isoleucine patch superfamily enzyme